MPGPQRTARDTLGTAATLALAQPAARPFAASAGTRRPVTAADGYTIHVVAPHMISGQEMGPVHHYCKTDPRPTRSYSAAVRPPGRERTLTASSTSSRSGSRPGGVSRERGTQLHDHTLEIRDGPVKGSYMPRRRQRKSPSVSQYDSDHLQPVERETASTHRQRGDGSSSVTSVSADRVSGGGAMTITQAATTRDRSSYRDDALGSTNGWARAADPSVACRGGTWIPRVREGKMRAPPGGTGRRALRPPHGESCRSGSSSPSSAGRESRRTPHRPLGDNSNCSPMGALATRALRPPEVRLMTGGRASGQERAVARRSAHRGYEVHAESPSFVPCAPSRLGTRSTHATMRSSMCGALSTGGVIAQRVWRRLANVEAIPAREHPWSAPQRRRKLKECRGDARTVSGRA